MTQQVHPRRNLCSFPGSALLAHTRIARFAMRHDQTMFLFVFADPGGRYLEQPVIDHKDILRAEFGGAGWECSQILEAMESCGDIYFDRDFFSQPNNKGF